MSQVLKERYGKDIDYAIELQVDDDIVINRLQNRFICLDCGSISSFANVDDAVCAKCNSVRLEKRVDDVNMSAIQKRISEYHIQMKGLREYYKDKLLSINASLSIDRVTEEIEAKISCNLI